MDQLLIPLKSWEVLPRLPSQTEMVLLKLKLKCKVEYVVITFSLLYLHTEVFSDTPLSVCILNVSKYCCPSILAPRVLHFGAIHSFWMQVLPLLCHIIYLYSRGEEARASHQGPEGPPGEEMEVSGEGAWLQHHRHRRH